MLNDSLPYRSLDQIQEALSDGTTTCVALVNHYLTNIDRDSDLNVFVEVYRDEALARAHALDQVSGGGRGRLWGAVISVKDVISHEGHGLTAGSRMLQGYTALYSATAIERMLAEDAIIIGRVNCDEFAMGSDNQTSYYGGTKNGHHPDHVPGGSSGGCAVSVQMDHCLLSMGSDTGGSVRQPASFCGLTGFKPSYGRISRFGLIAYGSSFDQIGFIGHVLKDIALVYDIVQGPDGKDSTLVREQPESTGSHKPNKILKFGYLGETLSHHGLQREIKDAFTAKLGVLREEGHAVDALSFEYLDYLIPAYYVLTSAEASSNLSRYDGIRYGHRSREASSLDDMYTHSRTEGFGTEVKRRILLGTFVLSVGYYDAYFAKAQKVRRLIKERFERWFEQYDAILIPTAPVTAWSLDATLSPVEMYLADVFSVIANLTGMPAISIPLGVDDQGLPFGMQVLARRYGESELFRVASSLVR